MICLSLPRQRLSQNLAVTKKHGFTSYTNHSHDGGGRMSAPLLITGLTFWSIESLTYAWVTFTLTAHPWNQSALIQTDGFPEHGSVRNSYRRDVGSRSPLYRVAIWTVHLSVWPRVVSVLMCAWPKHAYIMKHEYSWAEHEHNFYFPQNFHKMT